MKYILTAFSLCLTLLLSAQSNNSIEILNAMIQKIESSRNVGYEAFINEKSLFGTDTSKRYINGKVFIDSLGQIISSDFYLKQDNYKGHQIFTNQKIYSLETDSSYSVQNREQYLSSIGDLFGPGGVLSIIKETITLHPQDIRREKDTIINKIHCFHLEVAALDSVIDKEQVFTKISIYIDKNNNLPKYTILRGHAVISKDNFKVGAYDIYYQA